jgi:hypothetical protein
MVRLIRQAARKAEHSAEARFVTPFVRNHVTFPLPLNCQRQLAGLVCVVLGKRRLSLFILLTFALLLVTVNSAWATPTMTPGTPTAGQTFTVSGTSVCHGCNVVLYSDSSCTTQLTILGVSDGTTGVYSFTVVGGEPVGSYGAKDNIVPCVSFTVTAAPAIPEYPYGLPLLAILAVIAYGLIRRKTKHET